MKKILILKGKFSQNDYLINFLRENLGENFQVQQGEWPDVFFEIEPGKVEAFLGEQPISNFDLVWFRRTGRKYHYLAKALALVLEKHRVRYFDTAWGQNKIGEKLLAHVLLASAALPVIPSLCCLGEKILSCQKKITGRFGFPLVVKDTKKGLGKGVYFLKNEADIKNFSRQADKEEIFMFQKFYPNNGDFRIVVLGGKVEVWEKRVRKQEEFRNNVALGATEEFFPLENIPKEMAEISARAAKILHLDVAGVDVLVDKTGKFWILEVNRQPNFTPDVKVSPELSAIASFLKKSVGR